MQKNLFEILKQMNQVDEVNGTRTVALSNAFTHGQYVNQGAVIEMGVDKQALHDVMAGTAVPILLIVNKEEYDKLNA